MLSSQVSIFISKFWRVYVLRDERKRALSIDKTAGVGANANLVDPLKWRYYRDA